MKQLVMMIGLGAWLSVAHAATGCVMVANVEARIQAQGQDLVAPVRLTDCEGAKVLAGSVSVCFLNDKAQRTCRNLKAGEAFDSKLFSANANAGTGAFRATLASLFKGDPQSRIGQTRDNPPYPGFPYKQVLLPAGDMVIHLLTPKTKRVATFSLFTSGSQVPALTVTPTDDRLHIPANALTRGTEYTWEARGENVKFDGRFRVASADEAKQMVAATSATIADSTLDENGRRVLLAEIYFENGYAFDAEGMIAAAGLAKSR